MADAAVAEGRRTLLGARARHEQRRSRALDAHRLSGEHWHDEHPDANNRLLRTVPHRSKRPTGRPSTACAPRAARFT